MCHPYIPRARQNSTILANIEVVFADVADVIERRFESHIINVRPDRTRYRSLTDTQLQIIRTLIVPGAAENPFPERLQLRNWLMIDGYDLERTTDELRRVSGWSDASTMPRRYASRYLAESANRHNAERTSAAWSRRENQGGLLCLNLLVKITLHPPPL